MDNLTMTSRFVIETLMTRLEIDYLAVEDIDKIVIIFNRDSESAMDDTVKIFTAGREVAYVIHDLVSEEFFELLDKKITELDVLDH